MCFLLFRSIFFEYPAHRGRALRDLFVKDIAKVNIAEQSLINASANRSAMQRGLSVIASLSVANFFRATRHQKNSQMTSSADVN